MPLYQLNQDDKVRLIFASTPQGAKNFALSAIKDAMTVKQIDPMGAIALFAKGVQVEHAVEPTEPVVPKLGSGVEIKGFDNPTGEARTELGLGGMPDEDKVDTSDVSETTDWSGAERGGFAETETNAMPDEQGQASNDPLDVEEGMPWDDTPKTNPILTTDRED